jgi:hypothetical protein
MKICLLGPRDLLRLPAAAIERRTAAMLLDCDFEVGDEPTGAGRHFQEHLAKYSYPRVRVWYRGDTPRANVGAWPTQRVQGSFSERDRQMCAASDFGFAVWDYRSPETGRNVRQLGRRARVIPLR